MTEHEHNQCVFCDIVHDDPHGQITSVTHIGSNYIATFEPLNPCTEGHLLFVPYKHVTDALDGLYVVGDCVTAVSLYARDNAIDHFNIIINCGVEASQTVNHLHIHFIPRHYDDNIQLPWPQHQHKGE